MLRVVRASRMADAYKDSVSARLRLRPGETVVDVGSGLGDDVCALAALVGPTGRAIGLDVEAPDTASREARALFTRGDAGAIPLRDASVDAVRIERVLHLIENPERVLREVARVLRPGGRVVIAEPDNTSLRFPDLHDRVSSAIVAERSRGSRAGTRDIDASIATWLAVAGLCRRGAQRVSSTFRQFAPFEVMFALPSTLSALITNAAISRSEADAWVAQRESDDLHGLFQATFAGCIVEAERPGGTASFPNHSARARTQ